MNKRYILGVIITVFALTLNQAFIQYWLRKKENDAEILNISGKQRMLSQKINVLFYQNTHPKDISKLLNKIFIQWKETHQKLKKHLEDKSSNDSKIIFSKLQALDKNIAFVESLLNKRNLSKEELNIIYLNQQDFLQQMDKIVYLLQEDANRKLKFIVQIEYILYAISLLILILEVYLIYRPISNKINKTNSKLLTKNKELHDTLEELEVKNDRLEQYAFLTSHDLQEPLMNVNSIANILDENYKDKLDDQGHELLKHLKLKSSRISNMIKGLVDYNVVGTNSKFEDLDLNTILEEIYNDLKDERLDSDAAINWNELPMIRGLYFEIKILFFNLISNAIKFRKENVSPEILIDFKEEKNQWFFWIIDNGIGMNTESLERIFKMFKGIDQNAKYSGKGIGLAICKKIVDLHKGKIWVETSDDDKTYFYFTITKEII